MLFVMNSALSESKGPSSTAPSSGSSLENAVERRRRLSAGSLSSHQSCPSPPQSKSGPSSRDIPQRHMTLVSSDLPLPPSNAVTNSTSCKMDNSSNSQSSIKSTKQQNGFGMGRMNPLRQQQQQQQQISSAADKNDFHDNNDMEVSVKSIEDDSLHDFYTTMSNKNQRPLTPQQSPVQTSHKNLRRPIQQNKSLHSSLSALQTISVNTDALPRPGMHSHRQVSTSSLPVTNRNCQVQQLSHNNNNNNNNKGANASGSWQPPVSHSLSSISPWMQGEVSPSNRKSLTRQALKAASLSSIPSPTFVDIEPNKDLKEIKLQVLAKFGSLHTSSKQPTCASKMSSSSSRTIMTVMIPILLLASTFIAGVFLHYKQTAHDGTTPFWQHMKQERQAEFVKLLQQYGMDAERLLHDTDSDAHMAVMWLAHDDPLHLQPLTTPQPTIILQRFALATFYFATHKHHHSHQPEGLDHNHYNRNHKWKDEVHWMTGAPVCDWHGIECEVVQQSDWFDVKVGSSASASDATQLLQVGLPTQTLDVVRIVLPKHRLQGTLPPELRLLSQLTALDLSHNHMTGTLPKDIHTLGHFLRLTDLRLNHNRFSGQLPDSIANNMILKYLYLDHNQFGGSIPASYGHNLRNLREFTLGHNQLTADLPSTIGGLKHIEILEFNDNQIKGELPFSLCHLTTLRELHLQFNHLVGTIPSEFVVGASKLSCLDVSHNLLTGHLPDDFGKHMTMLTYFDVAHNELSGPLPRTLGQLSYLKDLHINHNHFAGSVPPEWGLVKALETLRLQNNKLGGSLPIQLAKLIHLEEIQIQYNLFRPNLPKTIKQGLTHLSRVQFGVYVSARRGEALKAGLTKDPKKEQNELSDEEAEEESILSSANSLNQLPSSMAPDNVQPKFEDEEM